MKKQKKERCSLKENDSKKNICNCKNGSGGIIYGLSIIGALFYFLSNATNFGMVIIGIGKAFFWPALLMFRLLTHLGV